MAMGVEEGEHQRELLASSMKRGLLNAIGKWGNSVIRKMQDRTKRLLLPGPTRLLPGLCDERLVLAPNVRN